MDKQNSPIFADRKTNFISLSNLDWKLTKIESIDSGPNSILDVNNEMNPNTFDNENQSPTRIVNDELKQNSTNSVDNSYSHESESNENIVPSIEDQIDSNQTPNGALSFLRGIPTSPHLNRDFSPNGERLRNSLRVRRQERLQKQRSLRSLAGIMNTQCVSPWDGCATNPSIDGIDSIVGKSKPYGEKGFIIHVNDGLLTLNDVKDLNNCFSDDFDSSCDTSLNYIESDSLGSSANTNSIHSSVSNCRTPSTFVNADDVTSDKEHQNGHAIESDTNLNLSKFNKKLDALKIHDTNAMEMPKRIDATSDELCVKRSNSKLSKKQLHPSSLPRPQSSIPSPYNGKVSLKPSGHSDSFNSSKLHSKRTENSVPKTANAKVHTKNYCKNTLAFIEKISEHDRHLKPFGDDKKMANRRNGSNNKVRTSVEQELVTRKPPTASSPKKRTNDNDNATRKANIPNSMTRKRL